MHRRLFLPILMALMSIDSSADGQGLPTFDSDVQADKWLRANSATYAGFVRRIESRRDIRGYRFADNKDVPRGMVAWVDGHLEIQFNDKLTGANRVSTLIFEMANAARFWDHQQIDKAQDQGLINSAEQFGLAHEMIEFEALRSHRQVLVEITQHAGPLPREFFDFVTPLSHAIEDYRLPDLYDYLKAQKDSGHTAHYHKHFHRRAIEARALRP